MAIEFRCPQCNKLLRTPEEKAGRRANCPECGTPVTVPGAPPAPAAAPPGGDYDLGDYEEFDDDYGSPTGRYDSPSPRSRRSSSPGGTKPCPMCGEMIKQQAVRCRYCGEDLDGRPSSRRARMLAPHRAGLVLTMGILGWMICVIFSLVAWLMGNHDIKEIRAGRMDPEGEGMTNAGRIIGAIQCILFLIFIVIFGILFAVGGMR